MKISHFFVQVFMVIAIAISFVLSYKIWTNNIRYQSPSKSNVVKQTQTDKDNEMYLNEVYSPTEVIVKQKTKQNLIYNKKESIITELRKDISKWKLGSASIVSQNNKTVYQKVLDTKNSIQLVYPTSMSTKLVDKYIWHHDRSRLSRNYRFNRVIFTFDKQDKNIYLGNDHNFKIIKIRVLRGTSVPVKKVIKRADYKLAARPTVINNSVVLMYKNRVKVSPYSYLVSVQDDNTYISSLLKNVNSDNISTKQMGSRTTYSISDTKKLVSDSHAHMLTFYDFNHVTKPKNDEDYLRRGFNTLNSINTSTGSNVKLFSNNWKRKTLIYRGFVEGFPVFKNNDTTGITKIEFRHGGQISTFSSITMQVPIPNNVKDRQLKPTEDVLEILSKKGYEKKISGIIIGYSWKSDKENKNVVDLEPTYFVKIGKDWINVKSIIGNQYLVGAYNGF